MTILGTNFHLPARRSAARRAMAALTLGLALVLAGCAAPQTGSSETAPAPAQRDAALAPSAVAAAVPSPAAAAPVAANRPAPPMSEPLPAQRAPDPVPAPASVPAAAKAAKLDLSCKSDADCVVKDVGNCCGYFPRCVNVNAKVDPKAVQAQCARSGMASVCGFKPVEGCTCVKGECQDKMMLFEGQ